METGHGDGRSAGISRRAALIERAPDGVEMLTHVEIAERLGLSRIRLESILVRAAIPFVDPGTEGVSKRARRLYVWPAVLSFLAAEARRPLTEAESRAMPPVVMGRS